jgi:hypothetical protein
MFPIRVRDPEGPSGGAMIGEMMVLAASVSLIVAEPDTSTKPAVVMTLPLNLRLLYLTYVPLVEPKILISRTNIAISVQNTEPGFERVYEYDVLGARFSASRTSRTTHVLLF